MIDLKKFTKKLEVIVPIIDGWGQYEGRKIYAQSKEDAYYDTTLSESVTIHDRATALKVFRFLSKYVENKHEKLFTGYALGQEATATNFDSFSRKGFNESIKINFLNERIFETIRAVLYEDNRFYYYDTIIPKNNAVIREVKARFIGNRDLSGVRGITPEIRYYFLLANLQRESYHEAKEIEKLNLSARERNKRIQEFQNNFSIRLENTITKANGKLIRYNKHGNGYLVEWKVGNQLVKSTIKDDMRIISAGYCLSGEDKKHTLSSLISLARLFQEDAPLYLTRE